MFGRRIAATLAATVLALAGCASGFQGHERFLDVAGGRLHLTVSPA